LHSIKADTQINSIAIAPKNDKLLCGNCMGDIYVVDIFTKKITNHLQHVHSDSIESILFISNDTFATCSQDKTIKIFDYNTLECKTTIEGHNDSVRNIEKLNNSQIVSCSADCTVRIWDLENGECCKVFEDPLIANIYNFKVISNEKIVCGVEYLGQSDRVQKNQKFLQAQKQIDRSDILMSDKVEYIDRTRPDICVSDINKLIVWDIESETCLNIFDVGHSEMVRSIVHLYDEKIASADFDGQIIVWNFLNGLVYLRIEAHLEDIWHLQKLSNNSFFSCGTDKDDCHSIKIWDIESGSCLKKLQGHTSSIYGAVLF